MIPARTHSRDAAAEAGGAASGGERLRSCPRGCGTRGSRGALARAPERRPDPPRRRCHSDPRGCSPTHALRPGGPTTELGRLAARATAPDLRAHPRPPFSSGTSGLPTTIESQKFPVSERLFALKALQVFPPPIHIY